MSHVTHEKKFVTLAQTYGTSLNGSLFIVKISQVNRKVVSLDVILTFIRDDGGWRQKLQNLF